MRDVERFQIGHLEELDWNGDQVVVGEVNVCNVVHWNGNGIQEPSLEGGQRDVLPHKVIHPCHLKCLTWVNHSERLIILFQAIILQVDNLFLRFDVGESWDQLQWVLSKEVVSHCLLVAVNKFWGNSIAQFPEVGENVGTVVHDGPLHHLKEGRVDACEQVMDNIVVIT